ncbi:type II toxin-antitoxin system prevent-host-death family antitoxin [Streptoalloteichus hindustanus]|nr:type II toxin-antitoxin system prevent-host-death family antitoxin [Streptoalloteichus hindustanus]
MSTTPYELPLTEARARLGELVDEAEHTGRVTYLTRHGRRAAAIVPVAMVDGDELADRLAVREATIAEVMTEEAELMRRLAE